MSQLHETNVSTQQEKTADHLRVAQADEHGQGASGDQSAQAPRAQASHGRLTFPRAARITKKGHYAALLKEGRRFAGALVTIHVRRGKSERPRLGITVSRRYGEAHARNRFKRLVREAFRHVVPELPRSIEIHVAPRSPAPKPTLRALSCDLLYAAHTSYATESRAAKRC